jgi:16S rRNA processing protein RimM
MLLIVGQIIRPHGIRGEVIVDVRTDEPEQRFAAGSVLRTDPAAVTERGLPPTLRVEQARPHTAGGLGRLIVAFEGVHDRDAAESLRGVLLQVDSSELPPTEDPDEFHDYELVGLAAVSPEGEPLGEVIRVDHAPASDLLVLRRPDGRTALVPFVKAMVPEVDLAGRRVVLTPPPGLFEL